MRTPCGLAFEGERAEGRAIVRVHILDPAALANNIASTPCLFGRMATLGRETLQYAILFATSDLSAFPSVPYIYKGAT